LHATPVSVATIATIRVFLMGGLLSRPRPVSSSRQGAGCPARLW
jgi:hypothetical protein